MYHVSYHALEYNWIIRWVNLFNRIAMWTEREREMVMVMVLGWWDEGSTWI